MAKVIKAFRERFENFKKYSPGDEYPEKDIKRVEYLTEQGFLEKVKEAPKRTKKVKEDADTDA